MAIGGIISFLWTRLTKLISFLWQDKVPLIFTLAAALAAYVVSPMINEKFERQKMQATYILENLKDINGMVSDIYVNVYQINVSVSKNEKSIDGNIKSIRDNIAKLHWKLIETASMLPDEELIHVKDMQQKLSALNGDLHTNINKADAEKLMSDLNALSKSSSDVIETIGKNSHISSN